MKKNKAAATAANAGATQNSLNTVIRALEEKYKTTFAEGETIALSEGVLLTTAPSLDMALGGGIIEGTIVQLASNTGTGKTTLCLEIAAHAQQMYKKQVVFCDAEGRLRTNLLKCINGLVWDAKTAEKTGIPAMKVVRSEQGNMLTSEHYFNIIRDLCVSIPGSVIILDSVAALVSSSNMTGDIGSNDGGMVKVQKQLYELLRSLAQIVHANKNVLIVISHLQSSPGGYGPSLRIYGGKALEYFASYRLVAFASEEIPKDGDEKTGRITTFKVLKTPLKAPSDQAPIYIRYGYGIDRERDIVELAKGYGLVKAAGSWMSFTNSAKEEIKRQGIDNICEYLRENPAETTYLETSIRKLLMPDEVCDPNTDEVPESKKN